MADRAIDRQEYKGVKGWAKIALDPPEDHIPTDGEIFRRSTLKGVMLDWGLGRMLIPMCALQMVVGAANFGGVWESIMEKEAMRNLDSSISADTESETSYTAIQLEDGQIISLVRDANGYRLYTLEDGHSEGFKMVWDLVEDRQGALAQIASIQAHLSLGTDDVGQITFEDVSKPFNFYAEEDGRFDGRRVSSEPEETPLARAEIEEISQDFREAAITITTTPDSYGFSETAQDTQFADVHISTPLERAAAIALIPLAFMIMGGLVGAQLGSLQVAGRQVSRAISRRNKKRAGLANG